MNTIDVSLNSSDYTIHYFILTDLGISGVAIPVRTSAKDRERMQEAMIMQALREEGLITRPQGQGASGLSFEITAEGAMMKRPPPRLEKLEKRRKKKRALTEEEIREKLERAERRKRVSDRSYLPHWSRGPFLV